MNLRNDAEQTIRDDEESELFLPYDWWILCIDIIDITVWIYNKSYLIDKSQFSNWGVFNFGSKYSWVGMGGESNNEKWYN